MRQMVLGDSRTSPSHQTGNEPERAHHPSHALSALFHKCMRDVIILSYPTEITLLDMKLCQVPYDAPTRDWFDSPSSL